MKPSPTDNRRRRLLVRSLTSSPLNDLSPFDLAVPDDPLSLAVQSPLEGLEEHGESDTTSDDAPGSAAPVLSRLDAVLLALRPALPEPREAETLRIPAKIDVLMQDAAVLRRRIQQLAEQLESCAEFPSESVQEAWDDCRRLAGYVYWELDRGLPLSESSSTGPKVRKPR